MLAAMEQQKMNRQVEVTWRTLRKIAHSRMVHARVLEAYIHFQLMYMAYHIFLVLPIKDLINKDGNPTTPFKLATGTKPSVKYLCVLFCLCVVWKDTVHVQTKELNMFHKAQKGFCGILIGIPQHQKGYLVYVSQTHNIISSHNVVLYESLSSVFAYTPQPYTEAMDMQQPV